MKTTKPTPLLSGLAALAAAGRARIDRDQREDGIVAPEPPADELARQRAKRDQIRGGA